MVDVDIRHRDNARGRPRQQTVVAGELDFVDTTRVPAGSLDLLAIETFNWTEKGHRAGSFVFGSVGSPGEHGNEVLLQPQSIQSGSIGSPLHTGTMNIMFRARGH